MSFQSALSGLDIALWDIKGKRLGVPVWQLLGGKVRERIKVYGWIGGDHPSEVVKAAEARKAQGFTAVKMNGTGEDPEANYSLRVERLSLPSRFWFDFNSDRKLCSQMQSLGSTHPLCSKLPLIVSSRSSTRYIAGRQ